MVRTLFLAHRYLGIAVGLVMLIWTVSGIIMMYQEYPELDELESRALLESLSLEQCCELPARPVFSEAGFRRAVLEMQAGEPVLRVYPIGQATLNYNLRTGRQLIDVDSRAAQQIADSFVARRYSGHDATLIDRIQNDQWTVYSSYNPHRPLYKYAVSDAAETQLYVSSRSGEIVQVTTGNERLWGYLGAVIHWLYPTVLRQHTTVWSQTVIWLTILGIFLTAIGLYIGIRQFRRLCDGRHSPYLGMALLHHYTGLVFGVFTLTWVFSGLFSMNPWGALEGEGAGAEMQRLVERPLQWQEITGLLTRLSAFEQQESVVRYEIATLAGEVQLTAYGSNDFGARHNAESLARQPLAETELRGLAGRLQPQQEIASTALLQESDAYYYQHHVPVEFPVYRVVFADDEDRRYYLSPVDGQILRKVDREIRWYRWLFYGLHRGDFSAVFRSRPFWDIFMVVLLLGVTAVCATGCVMAWRRVRRDLSLLRYKAGLSASHGQSKSARVLYRGALLLTSFIAITACSEEPGDWIEVPLSDATFFSADNTYREDQIEILVLRNTALEYKLGLNAGDSMSYQWTVEMDQPQSLTAEFHGHTHRVGEEPGTVMFYKIHQDGKESGSLVAPFEGIHGWYFDNQSDEDITIQLRAAGFYELIDQ